MTKAMFSEILGKVWLVGMKKENIILVSEQQVRFLWTKTNIL